MMNRHPVGHRAAYIGVLLAVGLAGCLADSSDSANSPGDQIFVEATSGLRGGDWGLMVSEVPISGWAEESCFQRQVLGDIASTDRMHFMSMGFMENMDGWEAAAMVNLAWFSETTFTFDTRVHVEASGLEQDLASIYLPVQEIRGHEPYTKGTTTICQGGAPLYVDPEWKTPDGTIVTFGVSFIDSEGSNWTYHNVTSPPGRAAAITGSDAVFYAAADFEAEVQLIAGTANVGQDLRLVLEVPDDGQWHFGMFVPPQQSGDPDVTRVAIDSPYETRVIRPDGSIHRQPFMGPLTPGTWAFEMDGYLRAWDASRPILSTFSTDPLVLT